MQDLNIGLLQHLNSENMCFFKDFDISTEFYSKTGAKVDFFILPKSNQELLSVIVFLHRNSIEFKVLGGGTNTLFLDSVTYSVFISTKLLTKIEFSKESVIVDAGKETSDFVKEMSKRGYTGFEGLEGIPGSIAGALFMNAGAYGYNISDKLISVDVIDKSGNHSILSCSDLDFGERHSSFKKEHSEKVIISIRFKLEKGVFDEIEKKTGLFHTRRHLYLEYVYPNLGSIYALPSSDIYLRLKFKPLHKFIFKIVYWLSRSKFFFIFRMKKKNPNKKFLNSFVFRFLPFLSESNTFSNKTFNTFTNKNKKSYEIVEYIYSINRALDSAVKLENEIVTECISEVINEKEYSKTMELVKKLKENRS